MSRRVVVFARAPVEGRVKTRLSDALPPAAIRLLYERLLEHTVARAAQSSDSQLELWIDGDLEHPFFLHLQAQFPSLRRVAQSQGDLGQRMATALAGRPGMHTVLIGSDCPALDAITIESAFARLAAGADLVLGPAMDGGYVLLASRHSHLPVFEDVPWGTAEVLEITLSKANAAKLNVELLKPLRDIDRPEDLSEAERFGLLHGLKPM